MTRIIAVGELLAEFVALDPADVPHRAPALYRGPFPSGAPAIAIDQAAQCGAATAIWGAVGADGFGAGILDRLSRHGVDVTGIAAHPTRPTGTAHVAYRPDGTRAFVFHIEGSAATEAPEAEPRPGDILHVSGSSLGLAPIRRQVMTAADAVIASGGAISLDPNIRPELFSDPEAAAALRSLAARAAYLLPSLEDLPHLWPYLGVDAALDAMLAGGARVAAVKRGAGGVIVATAAERHDLPGLAVPVVDPTGAGDCFCGTLLAGLAAGRPLAEAAADANRCAARSVGVLGPMEGNGPP